MPKGKPKKAGANLGRSIIRQQFAPMSADGAQLLETERGKHKLRSVTQCDDLEELMSNAVLAGTDFASKRGEVVILEQEVRATASGLAADGDAPADVPIPRRPAWQPEHTAAELDRNEGAAFVAWRTRMAEIEERGCLLTPFEKNLEVWRQLWRVLERSQLIVQIVDARNPLLFRCADLERYAAEIDPSKRCMLLVNKADLLTEAQRRVWADYFRRHGIDFSFWSAVKEQAALEEEARQDRRQMGRQQGMDTGGGGGEPDGTWAHTIGLVGYPNVGKSSSVNVLVAEKKTCVSATPGKTKHFQTLRVPDEPDLLLCDCPGLVFPTVAGSKAQMICDGILPADTMKDYMPPVRLLFSRLQPAAFFAAYGVRLRTDDERGEDPEAPEPARELLIAHAISRGFMTATKGSPDESRSARIVIKDLINAKLLHCTPPPGEDALDSSEGRHPARRTPRAPTAARYLDKVQADYNKQKHTTAHMGGRKTGHESAKNLQWRPGGLAALPDRLVACGPAVP